MEKCSTALRTLVRDGEIHSSVYTDVGIFKCEMEKLFHSTWLFLAHESQIPQPGSFVTGSLGDVPVACVRGHIETLATRRLPTKSPKRAISVISALVHTLSTQPNQLEAMAAALAPQAMLDQGQLLKGARRVKQKVDDALADD